MNKLSMLPIALYLHIQRLRTRAAEQVADEERERGSSSAGTAVIIAVVVVVALTVVTIIGKKVVDKANSIYF